jgi:hypothetical protein
MHMAINVSGFNNDISRRETEKKRSSRTLKSDAQAENERGRDGKPGLKSLPS